jgi:hypothetical protein
MSARFTLASAAVMTVLGGAAAVTVALVGSTDATAASIRPTIHRASASSVVLGAAGTRDFTFSATVTDNSGIKDVKVLAWPGGGRLVPRAADMPYVESAACKAVSKTASACTYTLPVDPQDSTALAPGTWYVAVQATAKDHDAAFFPRAAHFTVRPATR